MLMTIPPLPKNPSILQRMSKKMRDENKVPSANCRIFGHEEYITTDLELIMPKNMNERKSRLENIDNKSCFMTMQLLTTEVRSESQNKYLLLKKAESVQSDKVAIKYAIRPLIPFGNMM